MRFESIFPPGCVFVYDKRDEQRDMMRALYRTFGDDEERLVAVYAAAEIGGDVARTSNTRGYAPKQYGRALYQDGHRKGWILGPDPDTR
jgi:hypothetical protein